jgi:hypothetical protein
MSAMANRRELIEAAQALAKTNAPLPEHYGAMIDALLKVYRDDTGMSCECILRVKENGGSNGS